MAYAEVEERIITVLRGASAELHTEEIAERVGLTRHTVSKYLQILHAKGSVRVRRVGNAKLWCEAVSEVEVRPLIPEDLAQILEIEGRLQRMRRAAIPSVALPEAELEAFAQTVEYHLEYSDPPLRLGAELEGKLVGFIFGEIRLWEFGGGEETGWIKILAVDPDYQRRGIGRRLGEALLEHFQRRGVHRVCTLVDSYYGELIAYFRSLGFQIVNMLCLERRITDATVGYGTTKRLPSKEKRSKRRK